ncbi:MAG: zeta toxin family protein [Chloroflexi bacterium]|nr:zeta toxin family protein [Chloroflexota bacterium]
MKSAHSHDRPAIIVVTGIMAAGKSTIARLLAQRFARGVHIEADVLQQMIVSGGEWAKEPGEPGAEAARQLRLRLKNMCLLATSFFGAGFSVVLDDIIIGDRWQHLQEDLQGVPFSLVVLAPRVDVVAGQRDISRSKRPLGEAWAIYLDQVLRTTMAGNGLWIDNSDQMPDETVDQILGQLWPEQGA